MNGRELRGPELGFEMMTFSTSSARHGVGGGATRRIPKVALMSGFEKPPRGRRLCPCRRAVDCAAVRSFSANGSDAVLRKFGVARHDRSDSPPCVRAQVAAAHAKPNQCARVKQILHQAFSHSAESSEKRLPLTAIFVPYPASGRILRDCSTGTTRAMGRPYRMIVKETTPDSTSESIPEKLAFASFTLIIVGMMESSLKLIV